MARSASLTVSASAVRLALGFVAGFLATITFHQIGILVLHAVGLTQANAWTTSAVPPFGVPTIISNCFWGGVWGAGFGLLLPRFTWPLWLCGLVLGLLCVVAGWFIVAPLKGQPIAGGWAPLAMLRSLLINGSYGLGVGLILPLLMPRALVRLHP